MVERRKPLLLASTKALLNSALPNPTTTATFVEDNAPTSSDSSPPFLQIKAGILQFPKDKNGIPPKFASLDRSSLVGLSTAHLKRLATTSSSLVVIKNTDTNAQRIGQVIVLDPPLAKDELLSDVEVSCDNSETTLVFTTLNFQQSYLRQLSQNVAYFAPLLAFNVDLYISCLTSLLRQGKESLASIFDINECIEKTGQRVEHCVVNLRLEPWPHVPRYASHLRISFLKIPECGSFESLRGKSSSSRND